ncbi:hypothetical protein JCM10296v2_007329 [Rhodotorula toruloides]
MLNGSEPPANPTEAASRLSKRKVSEAISSLDAALKSTGVRVKKRKTGSPHRTSTPALEAILAKSSSRASTPSSAPPPPSYEPTSLPALLSRLSTYRLTTFSPSKPPSLSSLACALHGWQHTPTTRERVQCVTCGRGVVLLPPSSGDGGWTNPAGQKLRAEHERLVLSDGRGHAETCPWRLRPCARSLYRLPGGGLGVQAGGRRRLIEDVVREAQEMDEAGLGEVRLDLSSEATLLVDSDDGKTRLAKALSSISASPPANGATAPPTATPSTPSVLLSIFGWSLPSAQAQSATPALSRSNSTSSLSSLRSLSSSPVLHCSFCMRQILASSYLPSPSTPNPKPFNPVKQHQPFCPFVDPYAGHFNSHTRSASPMSTQSPPSTRHAPPSTPQLKPGWQVRLEAILQRHAPAQSDATGSQPHAATAGVEGGAEGTTAGLVGAGKTKELLSYVRSLLGPKARTSGMPGAPLPSQLL